MTIKPRISKRGVVNEGAPKLEYDPVIGDEICAKMALGQSVKKILNSDPRYPSWPTLCKWKRDNLTTFAIRYAQAREDQVESWEEEIIEIVDDQSRDIQIDENGRPRSDNTAVNRDRLRADSRKWIMSKLYPRKYGEKLQTELSGKDGTPLIPQLNITVVKKDA